MNRILALLVMGASLMGATELLADTTLIPGGAVWKYLDNGSDQGTAWRGISFSDTAWASGAAELGYGDSSEGRPEATVVSYGPDAANKYITTYFRRAFNVANAAEFGSLRLRIVRDDGVVVYLNGQEIWRNTMPTGTIGYRTLASGALSGADEYTYVEATVPKTHLVTGQNVIAVEVHQANATSTDLSFNLELIGKSPGLVRQPYLQIGTPTGVTVRWRTDVATDSVVRYGASAGALTSEVVKNQGTPTTEHEVTLSGLTPDTRYFYSVGSSSTTYASGEAHVFFTSPPAGAPHPTRIWVTGDAGTGTAQQLAVRNAYYSLSQGSYTDVMLMLGDNVYETGTDSEYTTRHFGVYADLLRQTVTWPTIGNHDTAASNNPSPSIPYYQSFSMPTAGQAGGVPSGTEDYYSFDYGDIHFICLDSMTENRAVNSPMVTWLQQDLASTAQKWLIAYWHHPPYSKGHDSDTDTIETQMRTNVVPILEDYGVDLVLFGHSHAYERSYLMDGHYGTSSTFNPSTMVKDGTDGRGVGGYNKPTFNGAGHEGAVYAVAGSSGKTQDYAGIIDNGTGNGSGHPAMFISWERMGSLIVDVDGHKMDVKFLRENGVIADSFRITRGPRTNLPPTVAITSPANGAEFNQGVPITITANAADSDQGLQELVFYANSSRVATVAASGQSPYSHTWTPSALGTYRLEVRAVDLLGNSAVSDPVDVTVSVGVPAPDTTAPAAIANLSGTAGVTDVELAWRASGDDGADTGTAARYDIRYSLTDPNTDSTADKAVWWEAATQVANEPVPLVAGSTQNLAITGLSPENTYYFALKSVDDAGNVSLISNIAASTTLAAPPEAPSNLTAVLGSMGGVTLAWRDNSNDEDGFSIERSLSGTGGFTQLQWVATDVTTFSDTLVYAGTTYYYRIIATKGTITSAATNVARVTTRPAAPNNLSATSTMSEVTLGWNGSTGADSYNVSRLNAASGSFEPLATGIVVTTFTDSGLVAGTSYSYRVNAVNAGGVGEPAEITVQTKVPNPPGAPTLLGASAISASSIQLTWNDNAGNEDGFSVERSADGVSFAPIVTVGPNVASLQDGNLTGSTEYWYRVRAFNADGYSDYSNVTSATTMTPIPPAAPTNLGASAVSGSEVNLTWVDNANDENGFYVERSTDGVAFNRVATVAANVGAFADNGLVSGVTYFYRVQAFNAVGVSAFSNGASATTLAPPLPPTNLDATAVSKSQINLSWTDGSANETGFVIERSMNNNRNFVQIAMTGANVANFSDEGLAAGKTFYYRVKAVNAAGQSGYAEDNAATPRK